MLLKFRVNGEDLNVNFYVFESDNEIIFAFDNKYLKFIMSFGRKVFIIDGVRFISALSFKPVRVSGDSETNIRFRFEQNGEIIHELKEYGSKDQFVIEVAEPSINDVQVASQIFELEENYPNVLSENLFEVPQIIIKVFSPEGVAEKLIISTVLKWKDDLNKQKLGFLKYLGKYSSLSSNMVDLPCSDQNDWRRDDPLKFRLRSGRDNALVVKVKTYMEFQKLSDINPYMETPSGQQIAHIRRTFGRNLTESGRDVLKALEYDLFLRCGNGNWGSFLAPIVLLCQSSGTGKSKLAISLLKQHLGFYLVFRKTLKSHEKGYPFENPISDDLRTILAGYKDGRVCLNSALRSGTTVGMVLNFIAGVIVQYYRKYFDEYKNHMRESAGTINEGFGNIYEQVNEKLASNFDDNDKIEFKPCDQGHLDSLYKKVHQTISDAYHRPALNSVRFTSYFIKSILDDPELIFDEAEIKELALKGFKSDFFADYPFVFVLDEADKLASEIKINNCHSPITNGFEALIRALSYLHTSTKIIFLAVGTKIDFSDLNPPVVDSKFRKPMPFPIVLRGNLNSFAKEYPIYELKLTDKMLKNPLYFKFLCTLGRPLFSSTLYEEMLKLVRSKLVNGTAETFFYVPVLWMIITGISANVLSPDAGTYVASHMAYLMQIREDCRKLIVGFMSEPILALVAQKLIDENETFTNLFKMLKIKYESVDIDCGQLAEVFGCMIVSRAIWKSDRISVFHDINYEFDEEHVSAMNEQPSKFNSLWKTPIQNLLTDAPKGPIPSLISQCYPYYRIHTVESFLRKFVEGSGTNIEDFGLPQSVLEGYVNATHFIPLNRDFSEIKVAMKDRNNDTPALYEISSKKIPLADNRIKDKSRNVITKQLLKAAMLQFAGLRCPPGMYGFDLIVPVLLKRKIRPNSSSNEESEAGDEKDHIEKVGEEVVENDLTFIGIKIKRSSADLTSNIEKMQARLHIVKCAREDCSGENCNFCIKEEALGNIYKDQITILMSLDDEDSYSKFTSSTNYFKGYLEEDEEKLDELLETGEPVNIEEIKSRSLRFMEPLVCKKTQFGDKRNVLVSKSVWYDELVDFKAAAAKKKKKNLNVSKRGDKKVKIDTEGENNEEESNEEDEDGIIGRSDGFVHRQFCICTRGWSVFKNLLPEDAPKIAEDLFNFDMPSRILKKDESHGLAALITHDAGIMYPATSNVMKGLLGRETSHYKIYNLVSDCQEKILFHQEPSESVED